VVLDLIVRGGTLIDGSGRPRSTADIGVIGDRIVALGRLDEAARAVVDASGLVVAPGFVDLHTHYDAQCLWDPTLSPSPLHGVTTVIGGNCGFSLAPLDERDADYLMRMFARVEGLPLDTLQQGVHIAWRSTEEFLSAIDGGLCANAGFLVGHSALRRFVMHDAADRRATQDERSVLASLLREGLRAGSLGFSTSVSTSHNDHYGLPVPSRHASRDELLELCAVTGNHVGTVVEVAPSSGAFDEETIDVMAAMSLAANRPVNWNVLTVYGNNAALNDQQLGASDYAAARGAQVVALTLPDSARTWLSFQSGVVLDLLPGWAPLMALPDDEKLALLRDPVRRAEMNASAQTAIGPNRSLANWGEYRIVESFSDATRRFERRTVRDAADVLGLDVWDALVEIVIADRLATCISYPDRGQDAASWQRRVEVWRDARVVIGGSDAGAHLDMIDSFAYATTMLGRPVREMNLLSLEEAVHYLTDVPARFYGLRGRGRIADGSYADLVVFDADRVAAAPMSIRRDLPGGGRRIVGGATGIEHVFVNGVEVVRGEQFTSARPGRILHSGKDTYTVERFTRPRGAAFGPR
jgi:N-acyl-D-aspartate/D-glutamate deacylase